MEDIAEMYKDWSEKDGYGSILMAVCMFITRLHIGDIRRSKMDRLTIQDGNIGFVDSSQLPSYAALYEKLRKYEDLEEQERLLKLPCR